MLHLRIFVLFFRISHFFSRSLLLRIIGLPVRIVFKILSILFSIDLSDKTRIGKNFKIDHGQGLVINYKTIIGDNVILRQNTTIGNKGQGDLKCPIIGNNVNIGANVVIIGNIEIGDNCIIGAGSVIIKNIPKNSIVVGNPGRVIKVIS